MHRDHIGDLQSIGRSYTSFRDLLLKNVHTIRLFNDDGEKTGKLVMNVQVYTVPCKISLPAFMLYEETCCHKLQVREEKLEGEDEQKAVKEQAEQGQEAQGEDSEKQEEDQQEDVQQEEQDYPVNRQNQEEQERQNNLWRLMRTSKKGVRAILDGKYLMGRTIGRGGYAK